MAVVTKVNDREVEFYSKNYNKPIRSSKEEFFNTWGGIYLIAEPTEHSGEKDYVPNKRKAIFNGLIPAALVTLLLTLSFYSLYNTVNTSSGLLAAEDFSIYLQYFILLAGVVISALLLWYEIDKNNPLLKKVCTGIAKGDCNAILSGKNAKVFHWLSWSEVGFFYFTGSLLLLLFPGTALKNALAIIGVLNLLALPYIVFSVYYQWRVARQWCVLCLGVQALLLLGGINVFLGNFIYLPDISSSFLINALLIYILPVLLWYVVKPSLLRIQEAKNTRREYLRIKFNQEIFEALLKKQKAITIPTDGLGIDIGKLDASHTIIKVCNPYCGPCSKAHPKIDKLLEEIPNLKVKIIFTTQNKPEDRGYNPVSHLLAINESNNNDQKIIKQALDDWYLTEKKDYEIFAKLYPMNGEIARQGFKMEKMEKWCSQMKINATPTFIINGFELPNAYNIEDLKYFLLD